MKKIVQVFVPSSPKIKILISLFPNSFKNNPEKKLPKLKNLNKTFNKFKKSRGKKIA